MDAYDDLHFGFEMLIVSDGLYFFIKMRTILFDPHFKHEIQMVSNDPHLALKT